MAETENGNKRSRIRPVFFMSQPGVLDYEINAAWEGIQAVLDEAGVSPSIALGYAPLSANTEGLHESTKWYLESCESKASGEPVDANGVLDKMLLQPWHRDQDCYDVLLCTSDLFLSKPEQKAVGIARPTVGAIVSVSRFREEMPDFDIDDIEKCIKTEMMHRIGRMFGLIPYARKHNVISPSDGQRYCTNDCVMSGPLIDFPNDWATVTSIRQINEQSNIPSFCDDCRTNLNDYFRGPK